MKASSCINFTEFPSIILGAGSPLRARPHASESGSPTLEQVSPRLKVQVRSMLGIFFAQ